MKRITPYLVCLAIIATACLFMSSEMNDLSINHYVPLSQNVNAVKTNKVFTFAGESVPTNADCKERMDKQLLKNAYWHSSTLLYLKRANRYFPKIERILAEEGVPNDFKFLAVAESGLENVRSHAAAVGFWQIRKLAAKELNLEVYNEVDERYHLEKSTRAAAKYLKKLHKRFGSWTSAAAAYNVGPTRYAKTIKEQEETNFYNLNINKETSEYLFRIIAIKELMSHPEDFGFRVDHEDLYPPYDNTYKVEITETVPSWGRFAKENGLTYRQLKIYNPWLRDKKLTVKNNTYYIELPR